MVKIYKYSTVYNSEIVLDADDLKETTIEAVHPQPDKELDYDIQGLFL